MTLVPVAADASISNAVEHNVVEGKKDTIIQYADEAGLFPDIRQAASILSAGGLVAFPTETVYGLGANALNETAAKKIYRAKGRPSDNPLIVHISSQQWLPRLASSVSKSAQKLADAFWPGPCTLILKKNDIIPHSVTGGLDTVAIRYPRNPGALQLLNACAFPVAAPSANISGRPSPTSAFHVIDDLSGKIDMVLAGPPCQLGLESTIVDVSGDTPRILRPGTITQEMVEEVLGIQSEACYSASPQSPPEAPGMKYTHYSPRAKVYIVTGKQADVINKINRLLKDMPDKGLITGVLATDETASFYNASYVLSLGSRENPQVIAKNLFHHLRQFDALSVDIVYAESFESGHLGAAIMNRLTKAAAHRIITA